MTIPELTNPLIAQSPGPPLAGPLLKEPAAPTNGYSSQGDHVAQNGIETDSNAKPSNWVPVQERYLYEKRKIRVITIGAGFSGLMVAHKIQHEYKFEGFIDHVIYEKNADVGGTWFQNTYPGVACDVPAHIYTFTWGPNADWSKFYCGGPEICEHNKDTAKKFDLRKNIHFNAKILEAKWNEDKGKWEVKVEQDGKVFYDEGEVLINASGVLNEWHWPKVPGLKDFKGHLVHSAVWDHDYDYTGKTVAVIGNGSSAIQIVPKLQQIVKHMATFIRSPTWISSNFAAQHAGPDGKNFEYTAEQKEEFKDPAKLLKYRKTIEHDFNKLYRGLLYGTQEHEFFQEQSRQIMLERLNHQAEFTEKLIPSWSFGCRRLSPGDGYLESLREKNVSTVFSSVTRVTPDGLEDAEGRSYKVDAIVCATGFDTNWCKSWPVHGRKGRLLQEAWGENPESLFSCCAKDFPNLFFILGPNAPVGNGSLIPQMEWASGYAVKWAEKIAAEDIHSIDPKQEAVDDFNVYTQEYLKRTVYTSHCRSWYKNNKVDGPVTAMWAGSPMHFKDMMSTQRGEDFNIKYRSANRYNFFGNGITQRDVEEADLAYYLKV